MRDHVLVRTAIKEDIPAVHNLVRELAVYEKAEAQFIASLKEYEEDFNAGIFESLVAEKDDLIVGMTLYFMTYSTWKGKMLWLEDFVVLPVYRGYGIGQLLFDALLGEARDKGCKLVKWQVLDWNEPALNFYKKYDAIIEKEWWNGKIFLNS